MKTRIFVLIVMTSMLACTSNMDEEVITPKVEEEDHQKKYLQFHPIEWETEIELSSSNSIIYTLRKPVVYEDLVIVEQARDGGLIGLNRHTGEIIWTRKDLQNYTDHQVTVHNDVLLCFPERQALAIDPKSGQTIWQNDYTTWSSHSILANHYYRISTDAAGSQVLTEGDVYTGEEEVIHSFEGVEEVRIFRTGSIEFQDKSYILLNWDNTIHLFDIAKRRVVWSYPYKGIINRYIFHEDKIIITDMYSDSPDMANITALSITDGQPIWVNELSYTHLYFQSVWHDYLIYNSVGGDYMKINLSSGLRETFASEGTLQKLIAHDDLMYMPGYCHQDNTHHSSGRTIAVFDPESMTLIETLLPHVDKNTTHEGALCGAPEFDDDYTYLGTNMTFSPDGNFIYATGKTNQLYCIRICENGALGRGQ